jgi:hypothetical protein
MRALLAAESEHNSMSLALAQHRETAVSEVRQGQSILVWADTTIVDVDAAADE